MGEAAPSDSMEEILASIRKIISSDGAKAGDTAQPGAGAPRQAASPAASTAPQSRPSSQPQAGAAQASAPQIATPQADAPVQQVSELARIAQEVRERSSARPEPAAATASGVPVDGRGGSANAGSDAQHKAGLAALADQIRQSGIYGTRPSQADAPREDAPGAESESAGSSAAAPAEGGKKTQAASVAVPGDSLAALAARLEKIEGSANRAPTAAPSGAPATALNQGGMKPAPTGQSQAAQSQVTRSQAAQPVAAQRQPQASPAGDSATRAHAGAAARPAEASAQRMVSPKAEAARFKDALVAPATENAVRELIGRLAQGMADKEAARVEAVLRPMLKEWLDTHLAAMVEKIVREEISRIAASAE